MKPKKQLSGHQQTMGGGWRGEARTGKVREGEERRGGVWSEEERLGKRKGEGERGRAAGRGREERRLQLLW